MVSGALGGTKKIRKAGADIFENVAAGKHGQNRNVKPNFPVDLAQNPQNPCTNGWAPDAHHPPRSGLIAPSPPDLHCSRQTMPAASQPSKCIHECCRTIWVNAVNSGTSRVMSQNGNLEFHRLPTDLKGFSTLNPTDYLRPFIYDSLFQSFSNCSVIFSAGVMLEACALLAGFSKKSCTRNG